MLLRTPRITNRVKARPSLIIALVMAGSLAYPASSYLASLHVAQASNGSDTGAPGAVVAAQPKRLWEGIKVKAGDTLARLLTSRGHTPAMVHEIVASGPGGAALGNLKAGTTIDVGTDAKGEIKEISYAPDPYRVVTVTLADDGQFQSEIVERPSFSVTRFSEGVVNDSLFASGKKAGVSDTVILEMADAFSYDIDFALEVQQGDTFRVLYEEVLVDGKKVRDGDVLAAEFVNQGKTYRAVRYQPATGRAGYYTPEGLAMRKAFLRTPVDFARISSRYTTRRYHPVLHTVRAHKGVDYAAARGTPVRATGNGRIEYAGNKGGYGRVLIIRHQGNQSTLYAHLNGFAKNIRNGAHVDQGQIIGYVGSTGLASGPHLHYEFRVNGNHVDPLKVKTTQAEPIASSERTAFLAEASRLLAMMETYSGKTAIAQASPAASNAPRHF
jgi:murein DD-endopeptidase MepM/ murein hydrolase activator NlpD